MCLEELYQFCICQGRAEDPRGQKGIQQQLALCQKRYQGLSTQDKKFFDQHDLKSPYADTRILFGDPQAVIKKILVGIDIGVPEMLLVDQLNKAGANIDLVISHHPLGVALSGLSDVMSIQTALLKELGIAQKVAESLMAQRIEEVARSVHSANHQRSVDAARLLNIPLMCCHTPADNHVASYLQKKMDVRKPKTLKNVVDLLYQEPEYQQAALLKAGPQIIVGKPSDQAGKIILDMTGGTEGSKEIFARLSQAGVKTLLGMHMSEAHYKKVKEEYLNVIVAGHIASDNLGLNLLLDKLMKKNKNLEILECSGFRRVCR